MQNESKYETWAKQFAATQRLFERLQAKKSGSKHTERIYSRSLMLWHEFSGLTPDDTVAKWEKEAKADLSQALEDWDVKLDQFVNWLTKTKGFKKSVASSIHAAVKSLIKYNSRLRLAIGSPPTGVVDSLKPVTIDEFKKLDAIASPQQRWLLRGLKDSGMSREDFLELTYGDIKEDFEKGKQFVHLRVIRRKESVVYETFLGPNAVEILRLYLDLRRKRGEVITDKSWLTVSDTTPYEKLALNSITKTILRLGDRLGIDASPHRLRKTFETYLALSIRHPIILKYWMGHRLNMSDIEAKYVIPNAVEQLKLYEEAYRNIDLSGGTIEERAREAAKAELAKILTPEQKELMIKAGLKMRKAKQAEEAAEEAQKCEDGEHCENFAEIKESELLEHLRAGWTIVKELANGQVIVKR